MRALVLHAAGDARIEDRPEPRPPRDREVTLRVTRVGLCGTDASEYGAGPVMTPLKARHPASGVLGPIVLGHEFIGVVEAVGSSVERVHTGDRVAAGAGVWCGDCPWCRRGQTNLCASYWTFGLSADGGLTERITVPEKMLHPIAAQVTDDNAAQCGRQHGRRAETPNAVGDRHPASFGLARVLEHERALQVPRAVQA